MKTVIKAPGRNGENRQMLTGTLLYCLAVIVVTCIVRAHQ